MSDPSTAQISKPSETVVDMRPALCLVCDGASSIRHFLSLIMQGAGVDAKEFANGAAMRHAIGEKTVDLVIIDVPMDVSDPVETINALAQSGFKGAVQLISDRGTAAMEQVRQVGERVGIRMLPALKKPLALAPVQKIIKDLKIGLPPAPAARIRLDEALANNWIEFWYQPKIDLRRKRLAGVEAFPRVRHPQYGVLMPETFMPGAQLPEMAKLTEFAIVNAINIQQQFSSFGLQLPVAINVDAATLSTLPVVELVRSVCADIEAWPGLVIDIPEVQIVSEIGLAVELAAKLSPIKVKLAVDDAGRAHAKLAKAEVAPFAELKLDSLFVANCADDKINTPICRTVVGLAKRFGGSVVANGVSKAADSFALQTMGCQFGQGPLLGQPMSKERFMSLLRQRGATENSGRNAA